jgi:ribonuclease HII
MKRKPPGPKLFAHDRAIGARFVAGADEAGRGCLAGPLVAAAVLFDQQRITRADIRALATLNDSKMQTPAARAALYPVILRVAAKVSIVSRCAPGIDARGLHKTNLAALREALANVACEGAICLSDGFSLGDIGFESRAKETRDRYMRRVDERNPGWGFAQHVGYASPEHRSAIERLGVTPLHRLSFQSTAYQQLTLG